MKKFLLAFTLLLTMWLPMQAEAATRYICKCDTGSQTGCSSAVGSDAANGQTQATAWLNVEMARQWFLTGAAAGDQILFCRGGQWTSAPGAVTNAWQANACVGTGPQAVCAANPITIGAYSPTNCPGCTRKPKILRPSPNGAALDFTNGNSGVVDGGYIVRDLWLVGSEVASQAIPQDSGAGVFVGQLAHDVQLLNLTIDGFGIGVYCGDFSQRIDLRNSTIRYNKYQGTLWGCAYGLIDNNTWIQNGYGDDPFEGGDAEDVPGSDFVFHHQMYLSGAEPANLTDPANANNMMVSNNTFIRSQFPPAGEFNAGLCNAATIVTHSRVDKLTYEKNIIEFEPGEALGGCWGITADTAYGSPEGFKNMVIRGNKLVNNGGVGFSYNASPGVIVENNIAVNNHDTNGFYFIQLPDRGQQGGHEDTGSIIRNNTMYFAVTPWYSLFASYNEVNAYDPGVNLVMHGNITYLAASVANPRGCFDTRKTVIGDFLNFSHNTCYDVSGTATYDYRGAPIDSNRLQTNPGFAVTPSDANDWNLSLASGSPSRDSALAAYSAKADFKGCNHKGTPDRGALNYDPTCVAGPSVPKRFR